MSLCGHKHPEYPELYECNREAGHPGDHYHQKKNDYTREYENHWWPQKPLWTRAELEEAGLLPEPAEDIQDQNPMRNP